MPDTDVMSLYEVLPFSLLPEAVFKATAESFERVRVPKDTVLFAQEQSVVDRIYVLKEGAAERFFEQSREKTLKGQVGQHDIFGAVSILMNDAVPIRTLKVVSDSEFFTLNADTFLRLCAAHAAFREFFVSTFDKRSLNTSYRHIIDRQLKEQDFTLPFFNQPIHDMFRPNLLSCSHDTDIQSAARKMASHSASCIFVRDENRNVTGIVTHQDIARKVVAQGYDTARSVTEIMSSPLISTSATSQVFEAFLTLAEHHVKHLPVSDQAGQIIGAIATEDLIAAQSHSPYLVIKEIKSAEKIDELENIHSRLPRMLLGPVKNGANPGHLTRLITTFADAILERIIHFAIEEAGPPPCGFAFMIMGSEGRQEQTLKTDQDNAIVFEDIADPGQLSDAHAYFAMLSDFICTWLDKAGFDFCEGDNMASNPKWCQPLSVWQTYFSEWIHAGDPEDLLYSSIFFDFRLAWGSGDLTQALRTFLFDSLKGWSGFFRNLTENALYFKPPISFFKNFVVETSGEHKGAFDIKRAMLPIIDCARIYALKHRINETNTLSRLFRLYTRGAFTPEEYNDITQSYNYMMNLRFIRQVTAIMDEEKAPDNYINPKNLSDIDQTTLKAAFKKIESIQQKLNMEFIGVV